jgi:hypothetical protein
MPPLPSPPPQISASDVTASILDNHKLNDNSIIARDVRARAKWLLVVEADADGAPCGWRPPRAALWATPCGDGANRVQLHMIVCL